MNRPAEAVLSEIDVLLDELAACLGTERDWADPAAVEAAEMALRVRSRAEGTVLATGQVVPVMTEAYVERVVFGPAGRAIDVGARRRLFTGATRRAVEVRDLFCTDLSGCDLALPAVPGRPHRAVGGGRRHRAGQRPPPVPFPQPEPPGARRADPGEGRGPPISRAG